jgi:hypothetical protein
VALDFLVLAGTRWYGPAQVEGLVSFVLVEVRVLSPTPRTCTTKPLYSSHAVARVLSPT